MNRIVKEHYPVEKLPEELRAELAGRATVRLVVEPDPDATQVPDVQRVLADMATWRLEDDGVDSVSRVRQLRDDWDG